MTVYSIQGHIERIEAIEGCSITVILNELYTLQLQPMAKLSKRWNLKNNRVLPEIFRQLNIPMRNPTERVEVQWIEADERKHDTGKRMRSFVTKVPHPNLGKTKETSPSLRIVSEKLKINTAARRPEVRAKLSKIATEFYAKNPEKHMNANAKPSRCEGIILDYFSRFNAIHNHRVGRYWIDVFIPEYNIGIESFNHSRLPFDYERHEFIASRGITIIYIGNDCVKEPFLSKIKQYITDIDFVRPNPSFNSEDTVILGVKNVTVFFNNVKQLTVKRIFVHSCYFTFVSTTPDNCLFNI